MAEVLLSGDDCMHFTKVKEFLAGALVCPKAAVLGPGLDLLGRSDCKTTLQTKCRHDLFDA